MSSRLRLIRFFSDLTPKNIRLWDDFIRKRVTAQSSVHGYHKRLKPYTIVLLPKTMEILKKYDYNLNLMSNQKCNDQLKIIANLAKLHIN